MKTWIKRIIIGVAIAVLLTTGCTHQTAMVSGIPLSSEQEEVRRSYSELEQGITDTVMTDLYELPNDHLMLYEISDPFYHEEDISISEDFSIEDIDESRKEAINSIGAEVTEFINKKYDLNWKYKNVDIYLTDDESDEYETPIVILGRYLPDKWYLIISTYLEEIKDSNLAKAIIAHELIHYITHINLGSPFFYVRNNKGLVIGDFLHEGITETINYEFIKEKYGITPLQIHDGVAETSGYELLVFNIKAISIAFDIDLVKEALHGNLAKVADTINSTLGIDTAAPYVFNGLSTLQYEVLLDDFLGAIALQTYLSQAYFLVAPEKCGELIELTKEFITRILYITPEIDNSDKAILVWTYIAEYLYTGCLPNYN